MNSEFPSGAPPPEEDYDKMPIEERLVSKVWKARVSAYTSLNATFSRTPSDTDPAFRPYTRDPTLLKGMVSDSNAVAQEKGAEAVRAFVEFGGAAAGKTREVVLPALVDKCYGSARAGTKKAAIDCTLHYIEMEDVMGSEGPVTDVCSGLSAKQPKLVATCVTALKEMILNFGPKQVSPKPILKVLPNIFAHADKTVRAEGSALAVELHRWIGPALGPTIDQLKDIQAKELRTLFEQADKANPEKPKPARYLLSERAAMEAASAAAGDGAGGPGDEADEEAAQEAALDFVEPLDAFSSKEWPRDFDTMVTSTKWQERKETLEAARQVLSSNPKLKPDSRYDGFVEALVLRLTKDVNINVVIEACGCVEAAAKGLRATGSFGKHRDKLMPPLLEKCKEKKAAVVEALSKALDALFQTVSIPEILEDVITFSKHKNPNVKTESIRFLVRCLKTTKTVPGKSEVKPVADALVTASGDGSADVREAGFQGLGTLMKLIGERAMAPYMEELDDLKKPKVMEEFAKAEVKAKKTAAPPARAPPPAAAPPAKGPPARLLAKKPPAPGKENAKPPADDETPPPPPAKPPARLTAVKKPPLSSATPSAVKKPPPAAALPPAPKGGGKGAAAATEPVKFRFPPETAEERAAELIPGNIREALASGVWKERLQGAQDFAAWLESEKDTVESEIIVRALAKSPGWKESNFQVLAEVYRILRLLAEGCPTFGRASIALSIQPLCDKLGDIKLKGPAGETLTLYSEKTSFGFVLAQAFAPLSALKAPKAIADSLTWIDANLLEFGTAGVDLRSLIEFLLSCLKNSNAMVRTNATKVFSTLARFVGGAVTTFLGDINPQLRTTLDAEIEKAASNPAPAPTRFGAENQAASSGGGGGASSSGGQAADALDDLIPRVDLDKLVSSGLAGKLGAADWKERKEAGEQIQAILQANQRLKPNLTDLAVPLRQRCADSNISVRTLSLDIIAKIATGMNKGFESHARGFAAPVVQVLADAKAPIRASAAATLSAIAEQVGVTPLVPGMATVLDSKAANPMLKQDLFTWLGEWLEAHSSEKVDLAPLAQGAVLCLDDKLAAVRKAAQSVLPFIISSAGYKVVMAQTTGLKAASRNSVVPMIDAAKAQAAPAAAPVASGAKLARPAAAAAAPRSTTPAALSRTASPAPAASPRTSIARPGSLKAPGSLTGRTLAKPGSSIGRPSIAGASTGDAPSAVPTFKSRLGTGLKRPGSMAPPPAAAVPQSSGDKVPPFLSADPKFKAQREKAFGRGPNWISAEGTPRPELVTLLNQQCDHQCDPGFIGMLFSKDHNNDRDFMAALSLLLDYISNPAFAEEEYDMSPQETTGRVLANSDLIFKYITIRLTDNNTSISLKCLDVLASLVELLQAEQYHMSEYEGNCLLPCLISRFGDPKFRDRIREIFRSLTFVFPPSKLLQHFLEDGLPSKNAKVRTECLTDLGHLFSKNGLQVCTPQKVLPIIAKQISDRDASVRTAALLCLGEVYKICGDDVRKLVGPLPAKEMSLLDERLKRTSAPAKPAQTPSTPPRARASLLPVSPPTAAAGPRPSVGAAGGSRMARPGSMIGGPSGLPSAAARSRLPGAGPGHVRRESGIAPPGAIARRSVSGQGAPAGLNGGLPQPRARVVKTEEVEPAHEEPAEEVYDEEEEEADPISQLSLEQVINEVLSQNPDRSVMALKQIERDIKDTAEPLPDVVDALVVVIGKQIHRSFAQDKDNGQLERLRKHLLVTGTSVFDANRLWDDRTLGSFVNRTALIPLLTELLQRMIELSPSTDDTAQMYCKYLNIIVLRSFSACNLNTLLGACLEMLAQATEDMRELPEDLLKKRAKFAELVIKCLWKITKRLPDALKQDLIGPQQLLVDVEAFLQAVPPAEWKRRAADQIALQDLPLRTVKVILTHFSQILKDEALGYLEALPDAENSFVYSYLMRMMSIDGQEGRNGSNDDIIDDAAGDEDASMQRPVSNGTPMASKVSHQSRQSMGSMAGGDNEEAINAELRAIFERISNKNESRQGIRDLYEFSKRYPHRQASIDRSLEATGSIFQRYIRRALANHAAEDGDGGADLTRDASRDSLGAAKRDSHLTSPSARSSVVGTETSSLSGGLAGVRSSVPGHDEVHAAAAAGAAGGAATAAEFGSTNGRAGMMASGSSSATNSPSRVSVTKDRMEELRARFRQTTNSGSSATSRTGSSEHGGGES
ncbi:hypothetical protein OC846_001101 [Tilletia horrida]|uniref:TOG domain-containing protein n=1 Tax=Tilletia horrida TaxID=155126 RepID=A0AAN6JTU9_9BASI|nr:hypothetical protein OC846_001101 [Tilletia horrida]KAK0569325.1 hypothetical protein OC861_001039 [Tilletia horrida]